MTEINIENNVLQNNKQIEKVITLGIILVAGLGFLYLLLMNSLATEGFGLEKLKNEKLGWQKELEAIDIALAIPTSLYALESDQRVQNMETVEKRTYLEMKSGEVAFLIK